MAKDIKGVIDLGLGELLGEANVVRTHQNEEPQEKVAPGSSEEGSSPSKNGSSIEQLSPVPIVTDSSNAEDSAIHTPTRRRRYGLVLGVCIGALLAVWIIYAPGLDFEGGEVAYPSMDLPAPILNVPFSLPLDTGALGGLIADLDREGQRISTPVSVPSASAQVAPPGPSTSISIAQQLIDLKGPLEPTMVKEAREAYRRNGGSEYAEGQSDGASPFGREKLPPFGGRRGKIIQGGETYRMLRSTMVFSEPDDRAAEIAELFTGDRVLAEERLGQWLKIRSQKGREGYIPMKVAEPLSEYYQRVPWEAPSGNLSR